jgi:3'(2'), 5'-bisphosphate nucleotidase
MEVYNAGSAVVSTKSDNSPITQADVASHRILTQGLKQLFPTTPIISEEGDEQENIKLIQQDKFWLVDPIDGTKEFIKRLGDFTVCLALVENGVPTFGMISAPVHNVIYFGGPSMGSFKQQGDKAMRIHVAHKKTGVVLTSRSNKDPVTEAYIAKHFPGTRMMEVGSQLKLPYIAEGTADAYPRIGSTMHPWDLAAGEAILVGAGGKVTTPDGTPVNYRTTSLQVGDFVATS